MKPGMAWLVAGAALALSGAGDAIAQARPITVEARQIDYFKFDQSTSRFGQMEFLGGLELTADDDDFGSFSGLDIDASGRLYTVSDRGTWLSANLEEDNSKPLGLSDAWIAPILNPAGNQPTSKASADAEALRLTSLNGRPVVLVSFEHIHEIWAFDSPLDVTETPVRLPLPSFLRGLRSNKGLEAVAVAPTDGPLAGATVAIAERSLDSAGNHRGFVLGGPRAGVFTIARYGNFDITDAAFLPDGDLLVLERRFSYRTGVAMRMRLIRSTLIRPGATVDGATLIDVGMVHQIDNLEGLAVRTDATGRTIVTLISDNNHSLLQRTLLLQFAYTPPPVPAPRLRPRR
jgi:hypothetical protein